MVLCNSLSYAGAVGSAGACVSATEDGRRLYLFGGNDGTRALNDVHLMEIEKLTWSPVPIHVSGLCDCMGTEELP
jgi:hypothetical protein